MRSISAHSFKIAAVALILVLSAAVIYLAVTRQPKPQTEQEWELANARQIISLKGQAESLAIAGKLPEAHEKYRELELLLGGRSIRDPHLWDLTDRAKTDADRIYNIILRAMANRVAPEMHLLEDPSIATTQPAMAPIPGRANESELRQQEQEQQQQHQQRVVPTTVAIAPPPTSRIAYTLTPATHPFIYPITVRDINAQQLTDRHVLAAMEKTIDFLLAQFKDGELAVGRADNPIDHYARNALCVYALAQAGRATRDPRLDFQGDFFRSALEVMKSQPIETNAQVTGGPVVYARSLRAAALATCNRPQDRAALIADVNWLINAAVDGAYTEDDRRSNKPQSRNSDVDNSTPMRQAMYIRTDADAHVIFVHDPQYLSPPPTVLPPLYGHIPSGRYSPFNRQSRSLVPFSPAPPLSHPPAQFGASQAWDNFNSQFAVLAVEAGAEAGVTVPDSYWRDVEKHWERCQLQSGQWAYAPYDMDPSHAMTCGGIASLVAVSHHLETAATPNTGRAFGAGVDPLSKSIASAIGWLEHADNSIDIFGPKTYFVGHNLFILARAAQGCGLNNFGSHDWYRELVSTALAWQLPDGSFARYSKETDNVTNTAFTLLFLAEGFQPILLNKLRLDSTWSRSSPEQLFELCSLASRELERHVTFQLVPLQSSDLRDWLDSPILFISSQQPLKLSDSDLAHLRNYALAGGTIFTQAEHNSAAFNQFIAGLAHKLVPEFPFADLPAGHELYSIQYRIATPHPKLQGVSNGSRLLLVHSPSDLATSWRGHLQKNHPEAFQLPINLFVYAAGQVDLRHRLDTPIYPRPNFEPAATLAVARVRYAGNWNPEPAAWSRFATFLMWETGLATSTTPVDLLHLDSKSFSFAHLTGTDAYIPSDGEIQSIRDYVDSGGLLLIDCCGGSPAFSDSIQTAWLPHIFPDSKLKPMTGNHPLLKRTLDGMEDVSTPRVRPSTLAKLGHGQLPLYLEHGKGLIIFSPLDLTTGLVGSNTRAGLGYESMYAEDLVKDALLWAYGRNTLRESP